MTVGELIELLKTFDQDAEVLIECRDIDNLESYESTDFYKDGTKVLHIDL